jgi:hypothetical protein
VKHVLIVTAFAVLVSCSAPATDVPSSDAPATGTPATATAAAEAPRADVPAAAGPAALSQRCTNERYGFTVAYPAGWHTNTGEVIPACSAFDPEPVQVPAQSEMPFDIAAVFSVQEMPFDRAGDPQFERVLSSERVTVAGRSAVRAEVESTGEGLADRGLRTLRYTIDLGGGRSLVATTNRTDASYDANREILARMVESLEIR